MGIYSNILLKKEKNNIFLERKADELLGNGEENSSSGDLIENAQKAIHIILSYFHIEPVKVTGCGSVEELLDAILDPERIMYDKIDLSDSQWKQQSNFILSFYQDGTPVILRPSIFGYQCYCPFRNQKTRFKKNNQLQDKAYIIYRPMDREKFSVLKFLFLIFRFVMLKDILCIFIATALVSALGLVSPALNQYVLHNLINKGPEAYMKLIAFSFVFVSAGFIRGMISSIKSFLLQKMKLRISTQVQTAVVSKILLMPYDYFSNKSIGKQSVQIRSAKNLTNTIIDFTMNNFLSVVFAVMYIPQMNQLAPELVIPALLVLLVQMGVSVLLCFASAKNTADLLEYSQDSDNLMFTFFKGIQKIKGVGAEKRAYSMVADRYHKVLSANFEPPILVRLNSTILSLISTFGTFFVLIIAASKNVSREDYISFTASYSLIASSVTSLVSMSKVLITTNPLIKQMKQLFNYQSKDVEGRRYVHSLRGDIKLDKICFSYDKGERECIHDVSVHIRRGEKVAFVGESGCGKSTLLKLILGVLTPDTGSIMFDGASISTLNKRSFQKRVGSVFQFSKVFPGTVFENIVFTAQNATEEDAWKAAEAASIAGDIKKLSLGMETKISESNTGGFSGGQKQRILLARAFAQKPSVLILDEATSALDNISQHNVLSSVYKMDCTVIMVAHRLSTVKDCDRIIVFKDGRIVEQGDYNSLMMNNAEFAQLVRKQQIEL